MSSGGFFSYGGLVGGYFTVAATVLCCYEHIVTFDREVRYVWSRRPSGGSVLFVVNRYAILAASLASIAYILPWSPDVVPDATYYAHVKTCQMGVRAADICLLLAAFAYAAFAALRMYALYGMSRTVLVVVFLVGVISPCIQTFLVSAEYIGEAVTPWDDNALRWGKLNCYHERPVGGDIQIGKTSIALLSFLFVILRIHAVVFEAVLLGLTWKKTLTWKIYRLRGLALQTPFTTVLLRDGTIYFTVIAIVNGLNIGGVVTWLFYGYLSDGLEGLSMMGPLVDTITSICMSRFILNLLAAADGDYDTQYRSSRWDTVLRFVQPETLGASLRSSLEDEFDETESDETIPQADDLELNDMARPTSSNHQPPPLS